MVKNIVVAFGLVVFMTSCSTSSEPRPVPPAVAEIRAKLAERETKRAAERAAERDIEDKAIDAEKSRRDELIRNSSDLELIEMVKQEIRDETRDPNAVQFRNVRVVEGESRSVCGERNAKNAYGAYVGFRQFIWGRGGAVFPAESTSALVKEISQDVINRTC